MRRRPTLQRAPLRLPAARPPRRPRPPAADRGAPPEKSKSGCQDILFTVTCVQCL